MAKVPDTFISPLSRAGQRTPLPEKLEKIAGRVKGSGRVS
jgi:hypothetical protein